MQSLEGKGYVYMVDNYQIKAMVHQREFGFKSKLCSYYASKMEPKIARTYSDDVDYHHGASSAYQRSMRPGLRDDEANCAHGTMLARL